MTSTCMFNTTCNKVCKDNCNCGKNGIKIIRPWSRFRTTCTSNNFNALNMRRKAEVLKYTSNTNFRTFR